MQDKVFSKRTLDTESVGNEALGPPRPKKTPVISTTIVKTVIERAVNIGTIVTPCSWNNVQILSPKDLYFSTNFPMVCLICATCFQIFFLFCDRICNHVCTFSLSICIGNCHLTFVAALQNFFNAWGFYSMPIRFLIAKLPPTLCLNGLGTSISSACFARKNHLSPL